jgi:general secretion pathway protein K
MTPPPDWPRMVAPKRFCGFALVIVLWVIAALTLTLTGAVYAVRNEVRATSSLREVITKGAASDAGIVMAARELMLPRAPDSVLRHLDAEVDGQPVAVEITSLTGLIDLNAAGESLLAALFTIAGGVEPAAATMLAQRVQDWRDEDDQPHPQGAERAAYVEANSPFRPRNGPFEAPEDLLQVLGVDYELYDKVKNLITVHSTDGNGQVDPFHAPRSVLQVLAGSNQQIAIDYEKARQNDGTLADSTRFPGEFVARGSSRRFMLESSMPLSSGAALVTRKIVDISLKQDGRPWTVIWSDRSVEAATAQ